MDNLQHHVNLNRLLNEFCNKDFIVDDLQKSYYLGLIANQISGGYKTFNFEPCNNNPVEITCQKFNESNIEDNYLHPLLKINDIVKRQLLRYIKGFYYYGSMSTMDYAKGWSDVDTFIVISKECVTNPEILLNIKDIIRSINKLKVEIDPLQHHGVNILCEYDLIDFPDIFVPIDSIGIISAVDGSKRSFSYHKRKTHTKEKSLVNLLNFLKSTNAQGVFKHHPYGDEYLLSKYQNRNNGMYQMKYYLGIFLLIPSLYLGVVGDDTDKKTALSLMDNFLSEESVRWIRAISNLRYEWNDRVGGNYQANNIPLFVCEYIPNNYFELGALFAGEILELLERNGNCK